jgi:hypothetical protein
MASMALVSATVRASDLSKQLSAFEMQIVAFSEQLRLLQGQIMAGEIDNLKDSNKTITEIRQWLKIGMELEAKETDENRKSKGIVTEYALDLGEARASIGCRFDRLRQCRGAK